MKQPNSEFKAMWREIVDQLLVIANQMILQMNWLPLGSHSVQDILDIKKKFDRCQIECPYPNSDVRYEVSAHGMTLRPMGSQIFQSIRKFQSYAGYRGKTKPTWVVKPVEKPLMQWTAIFPDKKRMKLISKAVKSNKVSSRQCVYMSVRDGITTGIISDSVFMLSGTVKSKQPLPNDVFLIEAPNLNSIYDECTVELYNSDNNKHQIMITNPQGWKVSSLMQIDDETVKRMYLALNEAYGIEIPQSFEQPTKTEYNSPSGTNHHDTANYNETHEQHQNLHEKTTDTVLPRYDEEQSFTDLSLDNKGTPSHSTPTNTVYKRRRYAKLSKSRRHIRKCRCRRQHSCKYIEHSVKKLTFSRKE